jgi:hypothetical protein
MNIRSLFFLIAAGIVLAACAGTRIPDRENLVPTRSDMLSMANDTQPLRPYSRYIYRITGKHLVRTGEGIIEVPSTADQELYVVAEGSGLRIHATKTFMNTWDVSFGDSDVLPFAGGNLANGRLEIMPWFSRPVEFKPDWFPESLALGVDNKCNLLIDSGNPRMSDIQKLVAFIDARTMLDRTHCELLGTFQTIPELQQIVKTSRGSGKYDASQNYVLRLNWGDTFALVRIMRR